MAIGEKERLRGPASGQGRLLARPLSELEESIESGVHRLDLDGRRDGYLLVPKGYSESRPAPLAVMLHGAGGNAEHGLDLLRALADASSLLILATTSRGRTWDVILGEYGPDVSYLDKALDWTFCRCRVDPSHIAVGGFSDGASYALSLGITNGDLFSHVIAFSPGFMAPGGQEGRPRIFISHGTEDRVLNIDRCSRRLVPQLRRFGYDVTYHEFKGPHTVPKEIARDAVAWFEGKHNAYHCD